MTEITHRRKRLAEDDEEDEHHSSKRNRAGSNAFKWLWSPSPPPETSTQGLWTFSDAENIFRSVPRDGDTPRSFSQPPEPAFRRTRRRGAISVTSSSPSELDRHLTMQLQQQIAIIRLKTAASTSNLHAQGNDDKGDELERVRRELEDVQIDSTLPSLLGLSLDFDRKLDFGSSRSPEASQGEPGSPTGTGCLWDSKEARISRREDAGNMRQQCHVGCSGAGREGPTGPGMWRRPRT
ncbi:uncharacterized protein CTRU02_203018 [Colletotrichum truncatum]|uniref:Uncharacterized protein n=1 Tax=Colletotrichum truncatum TaxID=5467 RepID=A0ACC3Z853_COLTU|nr:uncharacterized protein CTRU02_13161 [Colletotrichum truncatum]KAF6783653.1 hypothetical protein CTRU02_13161 [Colletotrichum truncatum]